MVLRRPLEKLLGHLGEYTGHSVAEIMVHHRVWQTIQSYHP